MGFFKFKIHNDTAVKFVAMKAENTNNFKQFLRI